MLAYLIFSVLLEACEPSFSHLKLEKTLWTLWDGCLLRDEKPPQHEGESIIFLKVVKGDFESSNQVDDSSYINSNITSFIWIDMTHTQDLRVFF